MKFHKLRIAWSVTNGIACLLLIVCWGVSYRFIIWGGTPINGDARLTSAFGYWVVWKTHGGDMHRGKWFMDYCSTAEQEDFKDKLEGGVASGFGNYPMPKGHAIVARQWAPVLAFAGLAALPWFPTRFTLRTLLIATTLVAVGLGLVVYAVRK